MTGDCAAMSRAAALSKPDREARLGAVARRAEGELGRGQLLGLVEHVEAHDRVDEPACGDDLERAVGHLPEPAGARVFEGDGEIGGARSGRRRERARDEQRVELVEQGREVAGGADVCAEREVEGAVREPAQRHLRALQPQDRRLEPPDQRGPQPEAALDRVELGQRQAARVAQPDIDQPQPGPSGPRQPGLDRAQRDCPRAAPRSSRR